MSDLDQVRKAYLLARKAKDYLSDAEELLDVSEGLVPPPFSDVDRFIREVARILTRLEDTAELKMRGAAKPCENPSSRSVCWRR